MNSVELNTCSCGDRALGICADCKTPVCKAHSGFWADDLLCEGDLAARAAEEQTRVEEQRGQDSADLLGWFDRRAAELVGEFLESVPSRRAVKLPVARRTIETRTAVEPTWLDRLFRDTPEPKITRREEFQAVPAYLVFRHYYSDRSEPPVETNRHVWVLADGRVAAAIGSSRLDKPHGYPTSGMSGWEHQQRERTLVPLSHTCDIPDGWEPVLQRPLERFGICDTTVAHLVADAPAGALPFFSREPRGSDVHLGRAANRAECNATLEWFANAIERYCEPSRGGSGT